MREPRNGLHTNLLLQSVSETSAKKQVLIIFWHPLSSSHCIQVSNELLARELRRPTSGRDASGSWANKKQLPELPQPPQRSVGGEEEGASEAPGEAFMPLLRLTSSEPIQ